MNWSVSEAKARLSELLKKSRRHPQVIENHGEQVAVVVSKQEWDRLQSTAPTRSGGVALLALSDALKAAHPRVDFTLELPSRETDSHRPNPFEED